MAPKPLNARSFTMPFAAFTMACLLFVYTRTSIRLAKENAKAHREADGGKVDWRNQGLRQHGMKEAPVGGLTMEGRKIVYKKEGLREREEQERDRQRDEKMGRDSNDGKVLRALRGEVDKDS